MKLRFWGVRGSAATPGPSTLNFGGNTSCVELRQAHTEVILFDSGTGIREAGLDIVARAGKAPEHLHLFLTHFHWDHIQGLPFFAPLYNPANHVWIYSSGFTAPLKAALNGLMSSPYFPVGFESLPAKVEIVELGSDVARVGGVTVQPFQVHHPQGSCAYKVQHGASSAIYAPDREHGDARLDAILVEQAREVGALVLDSQYTPEEYESHRGWGHSTWLESTRVARAARAQNLVLFHHDPAHTDDILLRIEESARREFAQTFVAREGWELEI
jgi:phosphoribosyl 1,2-cyclic phosphodiesterase